MGHEQQQLGGDPGGVLIPLIPGVGAIQGLVNLFNKPDKPEPVIPDIRALAGGTSGLITSVQGRIDDAIAAGRAPNPADVRLVDFAHAFRTKQEAQFRFLQQTFPQEFTRFGVPVGSTAAQAIDFLFNLPRRLPVAASRAPLPPGIGGIGGVGGTDPGFRPGAAHPRTAAPSAGSTTGGGFNPATFIKCLIASLLPSAQGGQRMPFVATPGFASSTGSFDFGGFGGILQSGINLASSLLAPRPRAPSPGVINLPGVQQAGFPLLAPFARAVPNILRGALPGFAGGAATELLLPNFFGGADGGDDTASFTDPVPGACRPKAHMKVNPCTGKAVWFTPRGKPLVFSGDMAACKRVDRVAKRLDKARPKRRHHHHTRHPR